MKKIKYIKYGLSVIMDHNEHNEAIAAEEADEGCTPEIIDDGEPEPVVEPTMEERIAALEIAMLESLGVTVDG